MCQGSTNIEIIKTNESLLKTYTYTGNIGILRNKHCPLLLPQSAHRNDGSTKTKCKFCRKVNQVLNKKIIRCQQHNKYVTLKKLSPKKRPSSIYQCIYYKHQHVEICAHELRFADSTGFLLSLEENSK